MDKWLETSSILREESDGLDGENAIAVGVVSARAGSAGVDEVAETAAQRVAPFRAGETGEEAGEAQEQAGQKEQAERKPIAWLREAKIFKGDELVLKEVNFSIAEGEFVYLVGRVGSGKSSLIETLTGQIPLEEGSGAVCGFSLERLRRKQVPYLRRSIGVVFQDFKLLMDMTVEKNLQFALRATGWRDRLRIEGRIEEVLKLVGLSHKQYKMPHQLSGGEQQRVTIARALLNDPQLILADEPTGNLDPDTSEGIVQILLGLAARGKSVLMATHNASLVSLYPATTYRCADMRLARLEQQGALLDLSRLTW